MAFTLVSELNNLKKLNLDSQAVTLTISYMINIFGFYL